MADLLSRWIPRVLKLLSKLAGFEFAVVVAIPKKESVVTFASPGGAAWLSDSWTDAAVTFPAAVRAAQLQRRTFAAILAAGGVDCSLPSVLEKRLQRAMMMALLDGVVDRNQYPFASTTTEEFRDVS